MKWCISVATKLSDEAAQDAFEYVLATGAVMVAFVAGLLLIDAAIPAILGVMCPVIDAATPGVTVGSCL